MRAIVEALLAVSGTIAAAIQGMADGTLGLATALALIGVGGMVAGVSPSGLTTAMAVFAQLQPEDAGLPRPKRGTLIAASFVLGMLSALVALGFLAAWAGQIVTGLGLAKWLPLLPLVMGLNMLGLIRWRWLRALRGIGAPASGPADAFWLGLPFGIATSPCALPVLVTVLTVAVAKGQALFAFVGLLAFGLGRSVPVLVLGFLSDQAPALPRLDRVAPHVRRVAGAVIVAVSLYFLTLGRDLLG